MKKLLYIGVKTVWYTLIWRIFLKMGNGWAQFGLLGKWGKNQPIQAYFTCNYGILRSLNTFFRSILILDELWNSVGWIADFLSAGKWGKWILLMQIWAFVSHTKLGIFEVTLSTSKIYFIIRKDTKIKK